MQHSLAKTRIEEPLFSPVLIFLGLSVVSVSLLIIQFLLGGSSLLMLMSPTDWLAAINLNAAYDTLSAAAEVVAAVLAIAITVVAIVVELAANRYSHEITRLFLREPINLVVLATFVLTAIQCLWIAIFLDGVAQDAVLPHAGYAITLGLTTLSLLILVPYIYFVFTFLSPVNIIARIYRDAYRTIGKVNAQNIAATQTRVEGAVDDLHDVARSAMQQGDRSIAMQSVNAMAELLANYMDVRGDLPDAWFDITEQVAQDPDFISLAPETMAEVRSHGIWLERKIFRRYLSLMGQAAINARDIANLIGINTRLVATDLGKHNAILLELCIRSFNSYIRTMLNIGDLRTAYYLLNQYRVIAESLINSQEERRAVDIANFLKEYGQLAHHMGFSFLLETSAFDVMQLIERAVSEDSDVVDGLVDCLLQLDLEIKVESEEESLLGVRRAQIHAAAFFLELGERERVGRIVEDLKGERLERLERLVQGLLTDDRPHYWELMDRGANFSYMAPERRKQLEPLMQMLRG